MTDLISFPPLHDLAPGEHEARKQHLLSEVAREPNGPRLSLPSACLFQRPRSRRSIVLVAVALAALACASVAIAASLGAFNGIGSVQHPQRCDRRSRNSGVLARQKQRRHSAQPSRTPTRHHPPRRPVPGRTEGLRGYDGRSEWPLHHRWPAELPNVVRRPAQQLSPRHNGRLRLRKQRPDDSLDELRRCHRWRHLRLVPDDPADSARRSVRAGSHRACHRQLLDIREQHDVAARHSPTCHGALRRRHDSHRTRHRQKLRRLLTERPARSPGPAFGNVP
jgi:hypothetical protein